MHRWRHIKPNLSQTVPASIHPSIASGAARPEKFELFITIHVVVFLSLSLARSLILSFSSRAQIQFLSALLLPDFQFKFGAPSLESSGWRSERWISSRSRLESFGGQTSKRLAEWPGNAIRTSIMFCVPLRRRARRRDIRQVEEVEQRAALERLEKGSDFAP